jgi:hypothetical protein
MDRQTLIAMLDFARARLLGTLDAIEKSGADVQEVLAWRPGPGRAHIGWQAMHCAATLDRYLNVRLRGQKEADPDLVKDFAGGSTPADDNVPTLATIRQTLEKHLAPFRSFISEATPELLAKKINFGNVERSVAESLVLLLWHEAHHQGQIHLTWNMYKAAHGIK